VKPKPAQENWYRVAICLPEFGQRLVAPHLQILEILRVIGAEPHHHGKVADLGGGWLRPLLEKKRQVLRNNRPCGQNCWHAGSASRLNSLAVN